jgi:hypothetical protein
MMSHVLPAVVLGTIQPIIFPLELGAIVEVAELGVKYCPLTCVYTVIPVCPPLNMGVKSKAQFV